MNSNGRGLAGACGEERKYDGKGPRYFKNIDEGVVNKKDKEDDIYYPDKNIEEADWTKKSWDLPPYKSKEFMKVVKDLNSFRKLPVYKNAVKKGLIKDDKWVGKVGNKKESKDGGPGSGIKGHTTTKANSEHRKGKKTGEFLITLSGGSIGEKKGETYKGLKVVKKFKTKEEAINYQKFMNKLLSPGDKKYYGRKYNIHAIDGGPGSGINKKYRKE
jgi:hypothetical protein